MHLKDEEPPAAPQSRQDQACARAQERRPAFGRGRVLSCSMKVTTEHMCTLKCCLSLAVRTIRLSSLSSSIARKRNASRIVIRVGGVHVAATKRSACKPAAPTLGGAPPAGERTRADEAATAADAAASMCREEFMRTDAATASAAASAANAACCQSDARGSVDGHPKARRHKQTSESCRLCFPRVDRRPRASGA